MYVNNRCFPMCQPMCTPVCPPQPCGPMYAMPQPKVETVVTPEQAAMPFVQQPTKVAQPQMPTCQPACQPACQPVCQPMCGGQFESVERVIEPTVNCCRQFEHHHRVEHIVTCVVKNVHMHHHHHDYVIDKKECVESHRQDHCLRNEDWCAIATGQQGNCCR